MTSRSPTDEPVSLKSDTASSVCDALRRLLVTAVASLAVGCAESTAPPLTEIVIGGPNAYPENITVTRDGTFITGSVGSGGLFRAAPGATQATQWIAPGANGLLDTFGVLADDGANTLWVCSARMDPPAAGAPPAVPALYNFDLSTGAFRSRYPLPGGTGLCNDIGIGPDRAAYVADTTGGRILRLPAGGQTVEAWAQSAELGGADGLAFLGRHLFVNSFTSGKLVRIELQTDGTAGVPVTLTTSRPLVQPDGMRRLNASQFVLAEGAGRIALLTVAGDTVKIATLRSGLTGPAGVAVSGNTVWALESRLAERGKPGTGHRPFKAYAIPLPAR